jgi:hypothetical protein
MTTDNQTSLLQFPSMRAAAAASGVPFQMLQAWKSSGVPGFEQSGRVQLRTVLSAVFARSENADLTPPAGMRNWREALNKSQAERTQLKLEKERESIIERAFVAMAIQRSAGDLNALRIKSENEDAVLFAGQDVAGAREILCGIWDKIFCNLKSMAAHFKEPSNEKPNT